MPDGGNGALHNENVCPRFFCNLAEVSCPLRNGADGSERTAVLDLANPRRNQILLDGFLIDFLQKRGDFGSVRLDDFLQNFLWIFVAGLHTLQVEYSQSPQFA